MTYTERSDTGARHQIYYIPRLRGKPIVSKGLKLSQAIEGFLLACRARRLSEHTLTDYSRTLRFVQGIRQGRSPKISPGRPLTYHAAPSGRGAAIF